MPSSPLTAVLTEYPALRKVVDIKSDDVALSSMIRTFGVMGMDASTFFTVLLRGK